MDSRGRPSGSKDVDPWGEWDLCGGEEESDGADGARLRPIRRRDVLHRVLYSIEHRGPQGERVEYTVEFDATREDGKAELYADGRRRATAEPPAAFPVPGGTIEFDVSLYGVRRVHLVLDDGEERRLTPVRGTIEDLRGRLHRRHPGVSRTIAVSAIVVLLVNLVLAVPQGWETLTEVPGIAAIFGTFDAPIHLPAWLNTALLLAGVVAVVERVLTLRSNRVIDAETLWTGL
ncbi:hypothetical protein [Nocardiopsis sp. MG754419]|uniref:hypothetical protein n=1 Tax=Nocardiopsis sp. MG754419 TaxID=2259865 RepID=UPI001BAC4F3D|nr:hypothetical protein [Nocardiopsis sp. MG754419]